MNANDDAEGEEGDDLDMLDEELVQFHLELEGDVTQPHHRDAHPRFELRLASSRHLVTRIHVASVAHTRARWPLLLGLVAGDSHVPPHLRHMFELRPAPSRSSTTRIHEPESGPPHLLHIAACIHQCIVHGRKSSSWVGLSVMRWRRDILVLYLCLFDGISP